MAVDNASDVQDTDTLPQTEWQRMDTHARTAYLVPMLGSRVRYILLSDAQKGRSTFGPAYPLQEEEATLASFTEKWHRPGVRLTQNAAFMLFYQAGVVYAFDDLYDVQLAPPSQDTGPDYDGADVYTADEVACPHCGAKLRITQRAQVERVDEDESEPEAQGSDAP